MNRWLLALAVLAALSLANGAYAHPLATWIGPLLMVRLVRDARARRDLALAWLLYLIAWLVGWSGVFRLGPAELAPMALTLSTLGFAPYLLDRWASRRLPVAAAILVLPCAHVAIEAGLGLASPFGAWGAIGYSQVELLPLAQLAALTGVHGLSFLPLCFASVANSAWERRSGWLVPASGFVMLVVLVLGYGMTRLAAPVETPRLAAAMVTPSLQDDLNYDERLAPRIAAELFAAADRAAAAGARLVAWPEDSLFVRGSGEAALIAEGARLAARRRIYLAVAYGVRTAPQGLAYRNRLVLIGPEGRVVWRYDKAHAVPGYEARHMLPGSAVIARAVTPFGIVAGAICFDGDHDPVMRAATGATILLLPSDDWPAIATLHARMARVRALEIGLPLLRPTINGIVLASDGRGRLLAWRDSGGPDSRSIAVALPLDGRPTFRALHPFWFPGAAAILLAGLLLAALFRRVQPSASSSPPASPDCASEPCASAK